MLKATTTTLAAAGITERPEVLLADSGYWSIANLTQIPDAPELPIAPARHARQGKPRKDGKPSASRSDPLRAAMTAMLTSEDGKARYANWTKPIDRGGQATHCGTRKPGVSRWECSSYRFGLTGGVDRPVIVIRSRIKGMACPHRNRQSTR